MAVRGTNSKEMVTKRILETFEGAFLNDKEIRIPLMEDGELIQLKCVLTCAKTNVEPNGGDVIPGEVNFAQASTTTPAPASTLQTIEPTQEEKDNVERLAKVLGF